MASSLGEEGEVVKTVKVEAVEAVGRIEGIVLVSVAAVHGWQDIRLCGQTGGDCWLARRVVVRGGGQREEAVK